MEKENKLFIHNTDEVFVIRAQNAVSPEIIGFLEITISKDIEKMPPYEKETFLNRTQEMFNLYYNNFKDKLLADKS